jgi:biopolymer transport protein ExbB
MKTTLYRMNGRGRTAAVALAALCVAGTSFAQTDMQPKLEASLRELAEVRQSIAGEKLPMVKGLNALEDDLMEVRLEYQQVMRQLDSRNLDLNNLRSEIKSRQGEKGYVSNLLGEYIRNFQTRVHIAELGRYTEAMDAAVLAPENSNLSDQEIFVQQTALVETSIQRLQEAVGGTAFAGRAAGEDGLVKAGRFLLIGPVALFAAADGSMNGIAEQQLGSLEATVLPFADSANADLVAETLKNGAGVFPFDPTLGSARKIEETRETFKEHLAKGGKVGYVIVGMFVLCVLISIYKWIQLSLVPQVTEKRAMPVLKAVLVNDHETAAAEIRKLNGPTAVMLASGMAHIDEPKDLMEEVMYEEMLTTRMRVNKFTPFLAVCASTAPLMGLLGTVTGIINTFKMITVFGSGDVKTLSGGISEALVTTEMGLIVAISALVFYAFLSRKAKSITDRMEQMAILFINRSTRSIGEETANAA